MKPCNLAKLKKKAELGLDLKLTKAHLPKFPQMEEELNRWIRDVAAANPHLRPPVTMASLQERAIQMAVMKGVQGEFKASNSWFSNFVKRYGLEKYGFQTEETSSMKANNSLQELQSQGAYTSDGTALQRMWAMGNLHQPLQVQLVHPSESGGANSIQVGGEGSGGEEGVHSSDLSHPDVHGDTDSGLVV
uniref:HTH CENPB-type domain-containing protein n=2 Tax=Guillardia theta TaxID=55529 RepID=A0A7S4P233_GUITH|mmetsp:Transcript_41633/g.131200  ORF Transcript_41633/g.131200 Transcript_41633/m.131200 type:complete len:190 (+) Transcript_41633:203-772(+)